MVLIPTQNEIKSPEENRNFLLGLAEAPLSSASSFSAASGVTGTTSPSAPSGSPGPTTGGPVFTGELYRPGGDLSQGLLSPLSSDLQSQQGRIGELGSTFEEQAGPSLSYIGLGGPSILQEAIAPGASAKATDSARSLLQTAYTGPTRLAEEDTSQVRSRLGNVGTRAETLRTGRGLENYLPQAIPGLTPGQAKFEAQRLRYNPQFQEEALRTSQNVGHLNEVLRSQEAGAEELAQSRQTQAAQVRDQAKSFLGGEKARVLGDIDTVVGQRTAAEKAAEDQFARFMESGSAADLPGELQTTFQTPGAAQARNAQILFQNIMDKYGAISQYDPLEPIMTKRGREWYGLAGKDGVKDIRTSGLDKQTQKELVDRQRELESLFGADLGRKADQEKKEFRDIAPLYGLGVENSELGLQSGQSFKDRIYSPQDIRPFVDFQAGVEATRENTATTDQRAIVNQISSLLEEADQLEEAGTPWEAARVAADIERYLAQEEAILAGREESLTAAERSWQKTLKKARSKYKDAQKKKMWGKIVNIVHGPILGGWGDVSLGKAIGGKSVVESTGATGLGSSLLGIGR